MSGLTRLRGRSHFLRGEGPAIYVFISPAKKDVDARDKPAHDE